MEGKVAVLGDADFVMPFSALGASTFSVGISDEEITGAAKEIIEGNFSLIVVCEDIASVAEKVFAAKQNNPLPCILVVPFTKESSGFATKALGEVLKVATGIDILEDN